MANQGLARQAGVSAFPTFHIYAARRRVAELRGANPGGLRREVASRLRELRASAGGAAPPAPPSRPRMANDLAAALSRVKASTGTEEFYVAARTLLTFVGNILQNPQDPKYRRVKLANPVFAAKVRRGRRRRWFGEAVLRGLLCAVRLRTAMDVRSHVGGARRINPPRGPRPSQLGRHVGGKACMLAVGFEERVEAAEGVLVMDAVPSELGQVRSLLEVAMRAAPAAGPSTSSAAPLAAVRAPAGSAATATEQPPSGTMPGAVEQPAGGSGAPAPSMQTTAEAAPVAEQGTPAAGPSPEGLPTPALLAYWLRCILEQGLAASPAS